MADIQPTPPEDQEAPEGKFGAILDNDVLENAPPDDDISIPLRREVAAGSEDEEDKDEQVEDETEDEDDTPAPQPTIAALEDPGEFAPKDYSFDVVVYDEDGKNGKTVTIKTPEQWDELLEKDPTFGTTAALMKAQRAVSRMEVGTERDKQEYDGKKKAFAAQQDVAKQQQDTLDNWQKEVDYLVAQKKLPAVAKEFVEADWSDPEIAKQPGVKEQVALFKYMQSENKRRMTAGLSPMRSVLEAYTARRLDTVETEKATRVANQRQAQKQRGAMVNRAQSAPTKSTPKGMIVGTGGSLDDLETFGLR